jgi:hypothetical protein
LGKGRMICFTASVTILAARSGVKSARVKVEKFTLRSTPRPAGWAMTTSAHRSLRRQMKLTDAPVSV